MANFFQVTLSLCLFFLSFVVAFYDEIDVSSGIKGIDSRADNNVTIAVQSNSTISDGVDALAAAWIFLNCNNLESGAIKDALKEAHTILESEGTRNMNLHWGDYSMVEFLGPPAATNNFRNQIRSKSSS